MISALKGFSALVSLLLAHGADPHAAAADGATALSLAQDASFDGIVALLNGVLPQ
jgi:hypothetical protein